MKGKVGIKMKKIITLLLALSCALALFACEELPENLPCIECVDLNTDGNCDVCGKAIEPDAPNDELTSEEAKLAAFVKRITSSEPTFIKTVTTYNDGTFDDTLTGKYETALYGENFKMYYEYERYAVPVAGGDPDGYKELKCGTIFYKDGLYSVDEMATWSTEAPDASTLGVKFVINLETLGEDYSFSIDGKTLTANLSWENAKAVLGVDINIEEDDIVELVIETDGEYLRKINVSYETDNADNVSIQTSYTYGPVESPFEEIPTPSEE